MTVLFDAALDELFRVSIALAAIVTLAVIAGRLHFAWREWRQRRFARRYSHTIELALQGDPEAVRTLASSPKRHRLPIALAMIIPLIRDRSPERFARTRAVLEALPLKPEADRLLASHLWWQRAAGLRAVGLLRRRNRTPEVVGALDDEHADVRGAALDALADLREPAALQAIVVRLQDATLHRGRRLEALTAYRADAEPFVLDLASIDPAHRVHYCRALAVCGTPACRRTLYAWTGDASPELRAAALMALSHVGIDDDGARIAAAALDDSSVEVRATAAKALHGWSAAPDVAPLLARRLDDDWSVAIGSARALQSIVPRGLDALRAMSAREDLAGLLSRQMLWELDRKC